MHIERPDKDLTLNYLKIRLILVCVRASMWNYKKKAVNEVDCFDLPD